MTGAPLQGWSPAGLRLPPWSRMPLLLRGQGDVVLERWGGPPSPRAVPGTLPPLRCLVRLLHWIANLTPPVCPPCPSGRARVIIDHALAHLCGDSAHGRLHARFTCSARAPWRGCFRCRSPVTTALSQPWYGLGGGAVRKHLPPSSPSLPLVAGDSHRAHCSGRPPSPTSP